jgi:hypothetical protein
MAFHSWPQRSHVHFQAVTVNVVRFFPMRGRGYLFAWDPGVYLSVGPWGPAAERRTRRGGWRTSPFTATSRRSRA